MEAGDWQKILLWGSFVFFLGSLLLRQEAAINQDLGRHLRLGQAIVENYPPGTRHQALATNFLTYTYPDNPFVNHHWGAEVIFYLIYKLGEFGGLILFKAMVLGAALGITAMHAANRYPLTANGKSRLTINDSRLTKNVIAVAITFFSIQMLADRLTTRPEIFGYLLFSILFWILDKKDLSNWRNLANWMAIPLVMILWVNLHISFVFGVILIWLWASNKILNTEYRIPNEKGVKMGLSDIQNSVFRIRYLKFLTVPVISTLATIFNPAGWRGTVMPLAILKDYGYTIVENMTPFFLRTFKPQPEYWIYAAFLVITSIMVINSNKRPSVFSVLSFYVFAIFPLVAVRHLAFFGLTAPVALAPLIRSFLAEPGDSRSNKKLSKGPALPSKAGPYQISTLVAGGLILAALTNPAPLAYVKLPPVGLTIDQRHEAAVKFVKERDLQGKMWNNYDIGSFLEWSLPEYPTFVDGRPEAFPAGFFRETYIPMQESREKWDEVVKNHDIQWAFAALTDATPWFQTWRQMIQTHEGWKLAYIDKTTAIYVKL